MKCVEGNCGALGQMVPEKQQHYAITGLMPDKGEVFLMMLILPRCLCIRVRLGLGYFLKNLLSLRN